MYSSKHLVFIKILEIIHIENLKEFFTGDGYFM